MDLNKQLKEVGLIGESNIFYEFDPYEEFLSLVFKSKVFSSLDNFS
jgi:hypothetical protein